MSYYVKYNGKPVYRFAYRANFGDKSCLTNVWRPLSDYTGSTLIPDTKDNILKLVKSKIVQLQPKQTLLFGKTSDFPRFKLEVSDFKRCIKADKADVVIVNLDNFDCGYVNNGIILEEAEHVYLVETKDSSMYRFPSLADKIKFEKDPINYLCDNDLFYITENITKVYEGQFYCWKNDAAYDISKILCGEYKKLALDKDLSKLVDANLDIPTKDDIQSICDLLESKDIKNQALGLKMLTGLNIGEIPVTIKTILGDKMYLSNLNEWKGVGVQQALDTIDWTGFGSYHSGLYHILNDKVVISDYDKELCREAYLRQVMSTIKNCIEQDNVKLVCDKFGIKVSYDVV